MYILNLEDNVFKHHDICKAIERGSFQNLRIDHVGNLKDGIERIKEQNEIEKPYDLIITDMWYPEMSGGGDSASGEKLIQIVNEQGLDIPVILCSSVKYRFPQILGSVHYAENEEWETEIIDLIKKLK